MSEGARLVKNTGILAIGGMATKLVQFFLLPLYTAVLSTEEFGTVDYLNIIAFFCIPVVTLLMDEALFRFLIDCDNNEDRSKVISCVSAVSLIGCLVFLVVIIIVGFLIDIQNIPWIAALVIAGSVFTIVTALLRGLGDIKAYTLASFLSATLTIVLNVIFIVIFRWGVDGMLAATALSQSLVSAVYIVFKKIWRYCRFHNFDMNCTKRLVRYALPLIPNRVSWTIMNMSSRIIVMNQLGAGSAGILAISYRFPSFMSQAYEFFYLSWKESSARILKSDEDENEFYNLIHMYLRRFMIGIVMLLSALTPFVFKIMIDGSYADGAIYAPILMLSTYYSNMSGFYGGIFTAHFETKIMGTTTIVSALICLVLNLVLVPYLGLYGAALASLVSLFFVNEYRRVKVSKYVHIKTPFFGMACGILCLLLVFLLYYIGLFSGNLGVNLAAVALAIVYFSVANRVILMGAIRAIKARVSSNE